MAVTAAGAPPLRLGSCAYIPVPETPPCDALNLGLALGVLGLAALSVVLVYVPVGLGALGVVPSFSPKLAADFLAVERVVCATLVILLPLRFAGLAQEWVFAWFGLGGSALLAGWFWISRRAGGSREAHAATQRDCRCVLQVAIAEAARATEERGKLRASALADALAGVLRCGLVQGDVGGAIFAMRRRVDELAVMARAEADAAREDGSAVRRGFAVEGGGTGPFAAAGDDRYEDEYESPRAQQHGASDDYDDEYEDPRHRAVRHGRTATRGGRSVRPAVSEDLDDVDDYVGHGDDEYRQHGDDGVDDDVDIDGLVAMLEDDDDYPGGGGYSAGGGGGAGGTVMV